ncbi:MAG: CAP domain-containing protein [Actinomycetota bacterium]
MPVQRPRRHTTVARLSARFLLAIGLVVWLAAAVVGALVVASPADANSGDEQRFIQLINQTRAGAGLGPLTAHGELTGQARWWANSMATSDQLAHAADISQGISAPWTVLGENVGVHGVQDVDQLHAAFVASPSHYGNIVDPRYTHIGVGVVVTDEGKLWTTHRFMAVATTPTTAAPTTTVPATTATTAPPTTATPATPRPTTSTPTTSPPTSELATTAPPTTRSTAAQATTPPPEARAGAGADRAATSTTRPTTSTTTSVTTTTTTAGTSNAEQPSTGGSYPGIDDAEPDEQAPAVFAPDLGPAEDDGVEPVLAGPSALDVDTVEQMLLDLVEAGI